ncbi:MAG: aminotransferase class III-fold pyridoxal phosphate-dependent enzyme [Firmicutes bacterium]|nr:aminotransferase class III-fold pyridoxal phosphate-dependent enzyme [Bacillota bacterium]
MSCKCCANNNEIVKMDRDHVWHHIFQHKIFENQDPLVIVEGDGCMVKDIQGREFLDAVSGGVWCVNVGYGRESIAKAVYEQLKQMPYYAMTAGNIPAIKLADKMTSLLPNLQRVFYSNSGSEANEKAFKMSRQYFRMKYPEKDKYKIIFRERDYHGTTIAALSATGQPERKMGYEPLVPGFMGIPPAYCYRCEFGKTYPNCDIDCARALEHVIKTEGPDTVAAVIVEPITAGGGILVPCDDYFKVLQEICRKYEVLLIIDEVVCGFARTGKWFGHQHWDVDPDMITMAKGMASSYMPLSATVTKQGIFDQFLNDPGDKMGYFRDISTYGGSAGACAAGLENIRIMEDEELCKRSEKMGNYLIESLKELESMSMVGQVRGKGLFAGVELVADKNTKEPADEAVIAKVNGEAAAQGVLLGKMNRSVPGRNNIITMAPALTISKEEIDRIVTTLRNALEKI